VPGKLHSFLDYQKNVSVPQASASMERSSINIDFTQIESFFTESLYLEATALDL
jgi:hypothetical protein